MTYIFSSPYYLANRVTGANKRLESLVYELQGKVDVGVVVLKGERPKGLDRRVKVYEIPKYIGRSRFLCFIYLCFLYTYFLFGKNLVVSDFNPIPVPLFFSKRFYQLIHDVRVADRFGRWSALSSWMMILQWKFVRRMLVVSNFTKRRLCEKLGVNERSILVSYNGIWAKETKNQVRLEPMYDLLYVATFEERKNHIGIIKSLSQIKTPLTIVFLGKDLGLRDMIKGQAANLGQHTFTFLDSVSEDELSRLYARSRVFISPSLYEGFGMPVLEAYASGCRVICSDIYVFREVMGAKAEYFDPKSHNDIKRAIELVLSYPNVAPRTDINSMFTWEEIAMKLVCDLSADLD